MFEFLIGVIVGAVFSPVIRMGWLKVKPTVVGWFTKSE